MAVKNETLEKNKHKIHKNHRRKMVCLFLVASYAYIVYYYVLLHVQKVTFNFFLFAIVKMNFLFVWRHFFA